MEAVKKYQIAKLVKIASITILGTLLLTISAKVKIPFYPVPMTMQTFVVIFIGMAFGWKLGLATVFAYLVEGAFGFPVFAGTPEKGIGIAYMIGPTGGYLFGFLVAVTSPKAWAFFPLIFPQFIDFNSNYVIQFLILITTYVFLDFLSLIAYAVAANKLIVWIKANPKVINTISACVLIVIAFVIAVTQNY